MSGEAPKVAIGLSIPYDAQCGTCPQCGIATATLLDGRVVPLVAGDAPRNDWDVTSKLPEQIMLTSCPHCGVRCELQSGKLLPLPECESVNRLLAQRNALAANFDLLYRSLNLTGRKAGGLQLRDLPDLRDCLLSEGDLGSMKHDALALCSLPDDRGVLAHHVLTLLDHLRIVEELDRREKEAAKAVPAEVVFGESADEVLDVTVPKAAPSKRKRTKKT